MERTNDLPPPQMPADVRDRLPVWDHLTFGGALFDHLRQCVNRRASQEEFRNMLADLDEWNRWQQFVLSQRKQQFLNPHWDHQWKVARALVQFAQADPAQTPKVTSAWERDTLCALTPTPRQIAPGTKHSIAVLLEQDGVGCLARLETELVLDGAGEIYPDPASNGFIEFDQPTFLDGAQEVWEWVKRQTAFTKAERDKLAQADARFRLVRIPISNYRNPQLRQISGRSAQAAFYLSLFQTANAYLGKPEALLLNGSVAASAAVEANGRLGMVDKLDSKLEAAYLKGLALVIVAGADEAVANQALAAAQATAEGYETMVEVVGVETTDELLNLARDRAKEREAVRRHEQEQCRKLNILDREVEIESHYQALPLLREVKRERLPRTEHEDREGRKAGEGRERDSVFAALRGVALQRWEEELRREQITYEKHSLDEVLNNFRGVAQEARSATPRFFVLGPPGSGKTTLAQYLAWRAANRALKAAGRQLLPVRVSLRRWERFCADAKRNLPEFLAEHYRALPHPPAAQHWQSWLQRGEVLLLLDGLDEVDGDALFLETLTEALNSYAECPTVITCRTVSFEQHQRITPGFPVFALGELSDELRDQYIRSFPAKQPFDTGALIAQLNGAPQMRALAANPLLLSIICYVAEDQRSGTLPTTRSELYGKVVEKFMRRRRMAVTYPGGTGNLPLARKRHILERAALTLFAGLDQQRRLLIDETSLLQSLTEAARSEGYLTDPASVADALLLDLTRNSGLLPGGAEQGYNFLHLTIQEYLTAAGIARLANTQGWETELLVTGKKVTLRRLVDRKAWDPQWQEVIAMLAGQLVDPAPLLNMLSDESRDDLYHHRLALAVQCLPELGSSIRQSHSELVDRITTDAFLGWCGITISRTGETVSHLTRTLPVLVQVNGCIKSNAIGGPLSVMIQTFLELIEKSLRRKDKLYQLEKVVSAYLTIMAIKMHLKNEPSGLPLLKLVSRLLCDRRWKVCNVAGKVIGGIGSAAATPEILALLTDLFCKKKKKRVIRNILRGSVTFYSESDYGRTAIDAVKGIGAAAATQEFLASLAELLRHSDRFVRFNAAGAIEGIGAAVATPEILTRLAEVLSFPDGCRSDIWNAVKAIGPAATPEFLACLTELLSHPDRDVQRSAAFALGGISATAVTSETLTRLAELLRMESGGMALLAIRELGAVAGTPEIITRLAELLRDPRYEAEARWMAAQALGKIGAAALTPDILNNLTQSLRDPDPSVRSAAADAIGGIGAAADTPEILTCLAELFWDSDWSVPQAAARAIKEIGLTTATPRFLDHLVDLSRNSEWTVRCASAEAIGGIGEAATPESIVCLTELLRDPDSRVRRAAAKAVGEIGMVAATPRILACLAELLHDSDNRVVSASAKAVGRIGTVAAKPEILDGLAKKFRNTDLIDGRYTAMEAVKQLGAAAATPKILAALTSLLHDRDHTVRSTAAEALDQLMPGGVRLFKPDPPFLVSKRRKFVLRSVEELSEVDGER